MASEKLKLGNLKGAGWKAKEAAQALPIAEPVLAAPSVASPEAPQRRTNTPTDGTLHTGFDQVARTTETALELTRRIESMQVDLDNQVIRIFRNIDEATTHVLNGEAYTFDPATGIITPVTDGNDLARQLEVTRKAAIRFAEIIEKLPQYIVGLTTSLNDVERDFGAILLRQELADPTAVPIVDMWSTDTSSTPGESVQRNATPNVPVNPRLEHGFSETARGLELAQAMVEAAKELKDRIDRQVITIMKTIDESATRALDGSTYEYNGADIVAVTPPADAKGLSIRLEATLLTAKDLVVVMQRLPDEIKKLITELHESERYFADVLSGKRSLTTK